MNVRYDVAGSRRGVRPAQAPAVRGRFVCELGECQYSGLDAQIYRPRAHFFHTRPAELDALRSRPSAQARIQYVDQKLDAACDFAMQINRVLDADSLGQIPLDHLQRWRAVLTRIGAAVAVRGDS